MTAHGRVAIITGAGRGIGKATALAFLRDGYRVAPAGRHRDTLDANVQFMTIMATKMPFIGRG